LNSRTVHRRFALRAKCLPTTVAALSPSKGNGNGNATATATATQRQCSRSGHPSKPARPSRLAHSCTDTGAVVRLTITGVVGGEGNHQRGDRWEPKQYRAGKWEKYTPFAAVKQTRSSDFDAGIINLGSRRLIRLLGVLKQRACQICI
jgi:hypothetical protein